MDFDESQHPRDDHGKFSAGGGGSSKFVSEEGQVSITKKKKWESTGAADDVSHHLERAKLHAKRAQEFADKAAKATSEVDKKKWATKAAVSRKYAIQNAKMAEKFAKKSGDPAHQKMAAEAKQLAETAKYHAGVAEHHASGAEMPQVQPIGTTKSEPASPKAKLAEKIAAAKPKVVEAPKAGSQKELAEKAHAATLKALASGTKEDHLAAAEAHKAAEKVAGTDEDTSPHYWAQQGHEKSASVAGTPQYDKAKAEAGTLKHAEKALKEANEKVPGQMSKSDYNSLSTAHAATLTGNEKKSVELYTGSGYSNINSQLRSGNTYGAVAEKHVPRMDSAIAKNSLTEDTVLYRGMGGSEHYKDLDVGDTFEDKGYVSTSAIKGSQFGGAVNLEIHASAGHPALAVRAISEHPSENEVILPRGSKFEIMSKEVKTSAFGSDTIHLKVRLVPIEGKSAKKAAA